MTDNLADVLAEFLSRYTAHDSKNIRIIIAVSGGADSMALLQAAAELGKNGIIRTFAAHYIHYQDHKEAEDRARLVEDYCKVNKIPCFVDRIGEKLDNALSPEQWMRQERYRFLQSWAKQNDCSFILTGHHADDQAETLLQRIIVGTGLRGLEGIRESRDNILRPFLDIRKTDLIDYCHKNYIPFADDPSNADLDIPRNRIRRQVFPLIEKTLNPDVTGALCRLGKWAAEANSVIDREVVDCFEKSCVNFQKDKIVLDIKVILTYFTTIQKYAILKALSQLGGYELNLPSVEMDRIADFLCDSRTGACLQYEHGLRMARDRDHVIIFYESDAGFRFSLKTGEDQDISELSLKVVWDKPPLEGFSSGDGFTADLQFNDGPCELILRNAREGDRFFPLGSPGEKRLFRFLADRKVFRYVKYQTPVLERDGDIIWVVGHRISEKARITALTDNCWRLRLAPINGDAEPNPFRLD